MAPRNIDVVTYVANSDVTAVVTAKRYSQEELTHMERCICGEAEGEPYEGMIAVGSVVMNRVKNKNSDIITIVNAKRQFDGISSKRKITDKCKKAAREVLFGDKRNVPENVLYFANEKIATDSKWISFIKKYTWKTIGRHTFYKDYKS